MQQFQKFSREKHVYTNMDVDELLKDVVRFFNGTPVQPLPPQTSFIGAGVYALYYTGPHKLYSRIAQRNRLEYAVPIYVGKAVPKGWRQARIFTSSTETELYTRLSQHARSIAATDLDADGFSCRFVIFEGPAVGIIAAIEAKMIELYSPVWNSCIDGFGNHDPGSGRYKQALSEWDILHPGREWAKRLTGPKKDLDEIIRKATEYLKSI